MEKNYPIIIAHRGASAYAPENTMAAFRKAVELSADGIEFDVKCTKDGQMIIIHDQTLDRTTDGNGRVVEKTYDELKEFDAGSFFSSDFHEEKIPLLQDVLEEFSKKLLINIELTNYASISDGLAQKAALLVKKMGIEKSVIFSSFHPYNLLITRRFLPDVPVAILALPGKSGWLARSSFMRWLSPEFIHPYFTDVNLAFTKKQHKKDRKVNVWTVNTESEIREMILANVDGIITDDPKRARSLVGIT